MPSQIHRDAASAWAYVRDQGGIELKGRDEGLDLRILNELDATAPSLDDALSRATLDAFARAFFKASAPYLAIFADILQFFEQADATQGQHQWVLGIDGENMGLDHFREWIDTWNRAGHVVRRVPALDSRGLGNLGSVLWSRAIVAAEVNRTFRKEPLRVAADVSSWVDAYNRGVYEELPASLTPPNCPEELRGAASIAEAALLKLRSANIGRDRLLALHRSGPSRMNEANALDFWTLAQFETDAWLRSLVVGLSAAATLLSESEFAALGVELHDFLSRFPTTPFDFDVSMGDLEAILSLPLWHKRNELYAVWIATEIVRAMKGHDLEFHHENGCMPFAFHEAVVVTVQSSSDPVEVIAERRSPLAAIHSAARTEGVQPDYGLWATMNGRELCRLAVEVKHYKKSARGKFIDVLEDYARSLPQADVYLVNHGPIGALEGDLSRDVRSRCYTIADLVPSYIEGRKRLAKVVRECVGEPVPSRRPIAPGQAFLVIDVSSSLQAMVRSQSFASFVMRLAAEQGAAEFVAIDTAIRGRWPATSAGLAALAASGGGATNLREGVRSLLALADKVVIITDSDGAATLGEVSAEFRPIEVQAPADLVVLSSAR